MIFTKTQKRFKVQSSFAFTVNRTESPVMTDKVSSKCEKTKHDVITTHLELHVD